MSGRTNNNSGTFLQAGVGAVVRPVRSKLGDTISVFDFMTPTQIAGVRANDGVLDISVALQTAIAAIQAVAPLTEDFTGYCLTMRPGTYAITVPMTLSNVPISITGSTLGDTIIKVTSAGAVAGAFVFDDAGQNTRFEFSNLRIDGNGKAATGILSAKIDHTLLHRVRITGTTAAAFSLGHGWDNDFDECEASGNTGDGIRLTVDSNNAVNIRNCKVFLNDGWGIHVIAGASVNITGSTIETNKKGGVYHQLLVAGGSIRDNYFEANGENGFTFSAPALNVKADIVINGTGTADEMHFSNPCYGIDISNNYISNAYCSEFIRIISLEGASIHGNHHAGGLAANLVGYYANASMSHAVDLDFQGNTGFAAECVCENIASFLPNTQTNFSSWKSDKVNSQNYAPLARVGSYGVISAGTGTLAQSATPYNGFDVLEISGGTNTGIWGVSIALASYPELAGKLVYFAMWARISSAGNGAPYIVANGVPNTSSYALDTEWGLREQIVQMPTSGTVTFGIAKISNAAGIIAYFTKPVIALVGSPFRELFLTAIKQITITYGSWTPAITFGGGSTGVIYTTQLGTYTRTVTPGGDWITLNAHIRLSSKGSSTGSAQIAGLPVAPVSGGPDPAAALWIGGLTGLTGTAQTQGGAGLAVLYLSQAVAGSASFLTDAHFTALSTLLVSITYRVA